MSRILLRTKSSPFEAHGVQETLGSSLFGGNSGNLLFSYSAARLFDTDDNNLSFVYDAQVTKGKIDAQWVNENFDFVVLPMANSFREKYLPHLNAWTQLIKQLKIPCVVLGIGIQLENSERFNEEHSYDEAVKEFIAAACDHSNGVGVRGEISAAYLQHLGFSDIEVIGCPSFALAGPQFPIESLSALDEDSLLSITGSVNSPAAFQQLMRRTLDEFPRSYFIPQYNDDLELIYYGIPNKRKAAQTNGYPHFVDDDVFVQDRARFFVNIKSMLEFNRQTNFNIGTRIHGCIGNVVCGTPAVLFKQDQRVEELARYHHLPLLSFDDITERTTAYDLYDKIDLHDMSNGHEQRFEHLVSFLDRNDLPHVWRGDIAPKRFPAEEKLENQEFEGPVRSLLFAERDDLASRLAAGQKLEIARWQARIEQEQMRTQTYKNQLASMKKDNAKLERKLDAKNRKIEQLKTEKQKLRESNSYRIGRAVTWLPRKIKKAYNR